MTAIYLDRFDADGNDLAWFFGSYAENDTPVIGRLIVKSSASINVWTITAYVTTGIYITLTVAAYHAGTLPANNDPCVIEFDYSASVPVAFPATQIAVADPNTLDDYEEGTWTPVLQFGGAAVGMTGTFVGQYVKVGRMVLATFRVTLTAKGSSTGSATLTGWPFTPEAIASAALGYGLGMAGLTSAPTGILNTTPTLFLYDWGATGVALLDDTNFGNTTDFIGSVTFRADA